MRTSNRFLMSLLAAAVLSAGAANEAQAQTDPAGVPYFISQSFLGFDEEGDGTFTSPALDFHESNAGPRNTFVNFSGNVRGASVSNRRQISRATASGSAGGTSWLRSTVRPRPPPSESARPRRRREPAIPPPDRLRSRP